MLTSDAFDGLRNLLTNDPWPDGKEDITGVKYLGAIVGGDQPSGFSRSPWLWNRFFQEAEIPALFTAFDLPENASFAAFAQGVGDIPELIDLTVTSPYKQVAAAHLAEFGLELSITERSRDLECLNHIMIQPGTRHAIIDLTDGRGLIRALKKRRTLREGSVLLVGAGGAATAIGYELVREGASLTIANIIEEDAERLAERLNAYRSDGFEVRQAPWHQVGSVATGSDIVISAVSSSSPLATEDVKQLKENCLCADTRYGTRAEFADAVRAAGRECIDGREMLCGQFAYAAYTVGDLLGIDETAVYAAVERVENWFMSL